MPGPGTACSRSSLTPNNRMRRESAAAGPVSARCHVSASHARKHNPGIGEFSRRLVSRGETFKRAMTACLRKLLVLMQTLAARGQVWDPTFATGLPPGPRHGPVEESFRPDVL